MEKFNIGIREQKNQEEYTSKGRSFTIEEMRTTNILLSICQQQKAEVGECETQIQGLRINHYSLCFAHIESNDISMLKRFKQHLLSKK